MSDPQCPSLPKETQKGLKQIAETFKNNTNQLNDLINCLDALISNNQTINGQGGGGGRAFFRKLFCCSMPQSLVAPHNIACPPKQQPSTPINKSSTIVQQPEQPKNSGLALPPDVILNIIANINDANDVISFYKASKIVHNVVNANNEKEKQFVKTFINQPKNQFNYVLPFLLQLHRNQKDVDVIYEFDVTLEDSSLYNITFYQDRIKDEDNYQELLLMFHAYPIVLGHGGAKKYNLSTTVDLSKRLQDKFYTVTYDTDKTINFKNAAVKRVEVIYDDDENSVVVDQTHPGYCKLENMMKYINRMNAKLQMAPVEHQSSQAQQDQPPVFSFFQRLKDHSKYMFGHRQMAELLRKVQLGEINANDVIKEIQSLSQFPSPTEVDNRHDGGSRNKKSKVPTRTRDRVQVGSEKRTVYIGPRGGKMIKYNGKWVSLKSIKGKYTVCNT